MIVCAVAATPAAAAFPCRPPLAPAVRTDLFFGSAKVGAAAWARFVAGVVTPRFPDGLTILDGRGQWRGPTGIQREPTRVLVIYHSDDAASGSRIKAIRDIYRRRFAQTSVMRADSAACIGF